MVNVISQVPNLGTALVGPLLDLERKILQHQAEIEHWFRCQWSRHEAPFYSSVDLRNAGFKLAPVDTNLFPAGFNNLNPEFSPLSISALQSHLDRVNPGLERVLIVPEQHTRNLFYLESLWHIKRTLETSGLVTRIGSLVLTEEQTFTLPSGNTLVQYPLRREGGTLKVDGFVPELILLNNDMSAGFPEILQGLEQPITPPLTAGWKTRRKYQHFLHYTVLAQELGRLLEIDPWLINPIFRRCKDIDFMKQSGIDCLVRNTDETLALIQEKYRANGVDREPFVVIKADAGTYGMGVITVRSGEELRELNRKQRTKMAKIKEGALVSEVFIQEGVHSFETVSGGVAEPVVYMIGHHVVGGFYRVHKERGVDENLNAPGMHFEPLAFAESCTTPNLDGEPDECPNRFYAYGVIARLACLAAARELDAIGKGEAA